MYTTYNCPICNQPLLVNNGKMLCNDCCIELNFSDHSVSIGDASPQYLKDSFTALESIYKDKAMFVFGKAELFTKDFRISDCVSYYSSKHITDDTPKHLLGYCGVPSIMIRVALNHIANSMLDVEGLLHLNDYKTGILMYALDKMREVQLTFDGVKALTALMAPTWFDVAEALRGNMRKDITTWSDSELLYSYIICNKMFMIKSVSPMDISLTLSEFILQQCKFVHARNDKLTIDNLSESDKGIFECILDMNPELNIANKGTVTDQNVGWLFGSNAGVHLSEDLRENRDAAKGLKVLWKRYGDPVSCAASALKSFEALDESSPKYTYIRYWYKVRERLQ